MTNTAMEQRARRQLRKEGLRLWKVPESSPNFSEYGPYSIVDADTNGLVAAHVDDLDDWLTEYAQRPTVETSAS